MNNIAFGQFRLDFGNECLWQGARSISLRPKAFAVLKILVENAGQLVNKQQVLDAVWPGTFVGDAVLKDNIRQLREALNDDAGAPSYIETAHRRGYRFIAKLAEQSEDKSAGASLRERGLPPSSENMQLSPSALRGCLAARQSWPKCGP
ncbi:MAG TPA: winged helix-turn-helix domain-containing protein [Candidatus Angelobacter sp.]|nr:winged helix-turn-helix domain-containing protein [Candidatus Angelobacter sp.]